MGDSGQTYNIHDGVHAANFIGRDQNITFDFGSVDVEHLIEFVLRLTRQGGIFLPVPGQPEALQLELPDEKLVFSAGAARRLAGQRSLRAYLLSLAVDKEYQRWATRFVPLAGKMDLRQVIEGLPISFTELVIPNGEPGMAGQITQRPLPSIAEAMVTHPAFVILGEPGAGKTTTQQKIAYDAALALLDEKPGRVPLFVRLSQQGSHDPYEFLQVEWERRCGTPFADELAAGRILFLADGINEIPRQQRNERLNVWRLFEQEYRGGNQLIFSGRETDYENQLNLPRVLVDELDDGRIAIFLKNHQAEDLAGLLDDPAGRLRELARNPLNLFVLVMVYLQGGRNLQLLSNRGRLFQSFTHHLISHEQLWHPDALSVDAKVELLSDLAYAMQQQGSGTTFSLAAVRKALPAFMDVSGEDLPVDASALLRFGRGAGVLDPATLPDVRFEHHLLQEYFAARALLRRFNLGEELKRQWQAPRRTAEMPPAESGPLDPLPDPPATGWEVTAILACGLSSSPEKLVEAIRRVNPALAGRCLAESGHTCAPEATEAVAVRRAVQADLLADLYDPRMHLRARLQAGFVLGKLSDPRFTRAEINGVNVILPQMVNVPGGAYWMGSHKDDPQAYDDESPLIRVELPAFSIGKWPVTNAEYACFMAAGGYQDERCWPEGLARRWLDGEEVSSGRFKTWLDIWKWLNANPDWKERLEQSGTYSPEQIEGLERIAGMSEQQLTEQLSNDLSKKSRRQPAYWDDAKYNNPSQPVVGVTWFEARAYCAWLTIASGRGYRLSSEAEWEAAARGPDGRIYPWEGDWDLNKANTVEGRVLKPSPVGAYAAAGGVGPFGGEEQAGNVWEWSSSLYLPYPYDPMRSEQPEAEGERVVRGGSWGINRRNARCAFRDRLVPVVFFFLNNVGFRVVSPGIFLDSGS